MSIPSFTGYVTVRLNSQRLPQKSIKKLNGSTLVNTAIKKLNNIPDVNEIILSCSDEKITEHIDTDLNYALDKRDEQLDSNLTSFNDILDSLIHKFNTDYILFLSVTSPFIKLDTITDMISKLKNRQHDSAFLAYEVNSFCWFDNKPLNHLIPSSNVLPEKADHVQRTQDLKPVVVENSGLYIFSVDLYKKHKRRVGFNPYIKKVNTIEAWDIDTPTDFTIANILSAI